MKFARALEGYEINNKTQVSEGYLWYSQTFLNWAHIWNGHLLRVRTAFLRNPVDEPQ